MDYCEPAGRQLAIGSAGGGDTQRPRHLDDASSVKDGGWAPLGLQPDGDADDQAGENLRLTERTGTMESHVFRSL